MRKQSVGTFYVVLMVLLFCRVSHAQQTIPGLQEIGSDVDCFSCHSSRDQVKKLPGGREFSLYVSKSQWQKSAHASMGCAICHGERPHPPEDQVDSLADWRRFETELHEACGGCHASQQQAFNRSIHAASSKPTAPNSCVACHDPHGPNLAAGTKKNAIKVCAECHPQSQKTYYLSIHGQNLALGNEEVAACFDCHGFHDVQRVEQAFADNRLVRICSRCHKNVPRNVSGWYSHAPVTGAQRLILGATELFYIIIIPLTVLSMIAHQLLKHRRTMEERRRTREEEER